MFTRKGWSTVYKISFSSYIFSIYSFSIMMSLRMHFIAYNFPGLVICSTRNTLPKVPFPIIFKILKSSSFAAPFWPLV